MYLQVIYIYIYIYMCVCVCVCVCVCKQNLALVWFGGLGFMAYQPLKVI